MLHLISTAGPHPYFELFGAHADRERFDVRLATVGERGALHDDARRMGFPSSALGATTRSDYPRAAGRLARRLRRDRIDVLQVHLLDASVVGLTAARLARTPVAIFTGHHSHEIPLLDKRLLTAVDRVCAGPLCDAIISPSSQMRDTFVQVHRVRPGKVAVIHHGFELDRLDPGTADRSAVRRELGLVEDAVVMTSIGRVYWIKNQEALLRAFASVDDDAGRRVLLLAGGGDAGPLQRLAESLGIADRVRLLGPRDDVPALLAASDLYVHPALAESFGMVILEAMAMGLPIVSTPVGIAPDVVEPGVTGWLTADATPEALATGLEQALASRDQWAELGAGSRRRAQDFPANRMVREYERLYQGLLGDR